MLLLKSKENNSSNNIENKGLMENSSNVKKGLDKNLSKYYVNHFNDLRLKQSTEDDIVEKFGISSFRDQNESKIVLLYSIRDGNRAKIILFILEKNSGDIFVLIHKEIIDLNNSFLNELNNKNNIENFNKILLIKQGKNEDKKDENNEKNAKEGKILINGAFFNLYCFGAMNITNKDYEDMQFINNFKKFNFTKKELEDKIKLYYLLKILVGNYEQEKSLIENSKKKFMEENKDVKDDISGRAIFIMEIENFYSTQVAQLKQIGLQPISKFNNFEKQQKLNNEIGSLSVNYTIVKDKEQKDYRNIKISNLPKKIFKVFNSEDFKINKKINISEDEFVIFNSLDFLFFIDSIHEVKIVSIDNADINEVRSICDSFLNFYKIESELKKTYPNLQSQVKY
ncbi:MAG: hypothetical protein ACK5XN_08790, partial [Bacteroidota bacterium]